MRNMDKVPHLPDTVEIDWEKLTKDLGDEVEYTHKIEIVIDLKAIDAEIEDAMKCVMLVPEGRARIRKGKHV